MAHIVKSFDEELSQLRQTLGDMGKLADEQLGSALAALAGGDERLAERVVAGDKEVDRLDETANDLVVRLLALRAPMADDLRLVVAALKIAGDLERIADYAVNIARRSQVMVPHRSFPSIPAVMAIGKLVRRQLTLVLEALRDNDANKAMAVWTSDQDVDESYSGLFRELLTYMMENPRNIAASSHLLFIAKNIERVGDHTTNIGEMVYYLTTGHQLDGGRPKSDSSNAVGGDED